MDLFELFNGPWNLPFVEFPDSRKHTEVDFEIDVSELSHFIKYNTKLMKSKTICYGAKRRHVVSDSLRSLHEAHFQPQFTPDELNKTLSIIYEYLCSTKPSPISTQANISDVQRTWTEVLRQLEDPVNIHEYSKGHLFHHLNFGGLKLVTINLTNTGGEARAVDLIDARDGTLLLFDETHHTHGWINNPSLINWDSIASVEDMDPMDTENDVLVIKYSPSYVSAAKHKQEQLGSKFKFAEYFNGKVYIEGEYDPRGTAVPSLKLSNARHANHTAVGYKATKAANGDPVLVKLGFLPDTQVTSNHFDNKKHRCNKAEVIAMATIRRVGDTLVYTFDVEKAYSIHDRSFVYTLGTLVAEPAFDGTRDGCGVGLHFYYNQISALAYAGFGMGLTKEFTEHFDNMSNAVYSIAIPSYLYVPVTEAARILQHRWRKRKTRVRITDMEGITHDAELHALEPLKPLEQEPLEKVEQISAPLPKPAPNPTWTSRTWKEFVPKNPPK